jgi:alpha-L-fucosidase 2
MASSSGRGPGLNLHNVGSNQSDASFGFTAAVAEALLQSHTDEISLLPAVPTNWRDGSVSGLRARDGYEVSMKWQGGKLQSAEISNAKGGTSKVRNGAKTATLTVKPSATLRVNAELTAVN